MHDWYDNVMTVEPIDPVLAGAYNRQAFLDSRYGQMIPELPAKNGFSLRLERTIPGATIAPDAFKLFIQEFGKSHPIFTHSAPVKPDTPRDPNNADAPLLPLTKENWEKLHWLTAAVNQRIIYPATPVPTWKDNGAVDRMLFGKEDYWADVLSGTYASMYKKSERPDLYAPDGRPYADCEEYVIAKQRIAVEQLFGKEYARSFLIALVNPNGRDGVSHAVAIVRTTHGDFVLDINNNKVLPLNEADYNFTYLQDPSHPTQFIRTTGPLKVVIEQGHDRYVHLREQTVAGVREERAGEVKLSDKPIPLGLGEAALRCSQTKTGAYEYSFINGQAEITLRSGNVTTKITELPAKAGLHVESVGADGVTITTDIPAAALKGADVDQLRIAQSLLLAAGVQCQTNTGKPAVPTAQQLSQMYGFLHDLTTGKSPDEVKSVLGWITEFRRQSAGQER